MALFSPYIGFLIYVAFANIKPDELWRWTVPQGNYSRTIALAFLLGWAANGGGQWIFGKAGSIIVALTTYWAWLLFGAVTSPAQAEAWYTFEVLSKVFIPLLAGFTLIDSVEKLKQLAWVLVLSQGILAFQFNDQYFRFGIDTNEWTFAGLDNNSIAISMVTGLGLTLFIGMAADVWWQRALCFLLSGLTAHVVLFSMSRGGMLAMCVTGAVAFALIPKRPIHYLTLFVALLFVVRLAGPDVRAEFFSSFQEEEKLDASAQSRYQLTRDAFDCMLRNPLMGCGMENWGNIAPQYGWEQGKRAHNTWAEIGATLGVPGLLAILAFYGSCCWSMFCLCRDSSLPEDAWSRWIARGILAGLAGFFASAWFVTVDRIELPYYIVLLGAGILKLQWIGALGPEEDPESADVDPEAAAVAGSSA